MRVPTTIPTMFPADKLELAALRGEALIVVTGAVTLAGVP